MSGSRRRGQYETGERGLGAGPCATPEHGVCSWCYKEKVATLDVALLGEERASLLEAATVGVLVMEGKEVFGRLALGIGELVGEDPVREFRLPFSHASLGGFPVQRDRGAVHLER
jgi:hypothetical protein